MLLLFAGCLQASSPADRRDQSGDPNDASGDGGDISDAGGSSDLDAGPVDLDAGDDFDAGDALTCAACSERVLWGDYVICYDACDICYHDAGIYLNPGHDAGEGETCFDNCSTPCWTAEQNMVSACADAGFTYINCP